MSLRRLFLILLLLVVLAGCDQRPTSNSVSSSGDDAVASPVIVPSAELLISQSAFSAVAEIVAPAVVNIRAGRTSSGALEPLFEDLFAELFRQPARKSQPLILGSGFIFSEEGYLLTNAHLVQGGEEITVQLSDQRSYPAQLIGADAHSDVAVLQVLADDPLPTVMLGDSELVRVGQWALAVGNPSGHEPTLSVGVLSAVGRGAPGGGASEAFLQTDASINPENSGGPLFNISGEVVGINTSIAASGQGLGFVIPINRARQVAAQLIAAGDVAPGWLGVSVQPLTPALAESFGLHGDGGALVNQVQSGSPAELAGVQRGDVLLKFAGRKIRGVRDLKRLLASSPVGQEQLLELLRDGEPLRVGVEVSPQPGSISRGQSSSHRPDRGFGLQVTAEVGVVGVVVTAVQSESLAARSGVRQGDRILRINRRSIDNLAAFTAAVALAEQNKNVVLLIQRGETTLYLAFPGS